MKLRVLRNENLAEDTGVSCRTLYWSVGLFEKPLLRAPATSRISRIGCGLLTKDSVDIRVRNRCGLGGGIGLSATSRVSSVDAIAEVADVTTDANDVSGTALGLVVTLTSAVEVRRGTIGTRCGMSS